MKPIAIWLAEQLRDTLPTDNRAQLLMLNAADELCNQQEIIDRMKVKVDIYDQLSVGEAMDTVLKKAATLDKLDEMLVRDMKYFMGVVCLFRTKTGNYSIGLSAEAPVFDTLIDAVIANFQKGDPKP